MCGEPFYFWGVVIKFAPVISIFFAAASIWFAMIQYKGKIEAVDREKVAVDENKKQEDVAIRTINELQGSITEAKELERKYNIDSKTTLPKLEEQLKKDPDDIQTRQKILIYKSLKSRR